MSDLVPRLRETYDEGGNLCVGPILLDAADEIERLREENKLIERALQNAEATIERLRALKSEQGEP